MKTKSEVSQTLREVWNWKEKVYIKLRGHKDKQRLIHDETDALIRRLGLRTLAR
jgi:hypothetical protein